MAVYVKIPEAEVEIGVRLLPECSSLMQKCFKHHMPVNSTEQTLGWGLTIASGSF